MFGFAFFAISVVAIVIFVTTFVGFFKVSRLQGKIFRHVENQLDRQMNEAIKSQNVECNYCGADMKATGNCPSCGAPRW